MLTFSYDVQHHSERGESSNHVEEGYSVLDVQTTFSDPEVQTTDQQWHEEGLKAVDQQGDQVSEVIVHVTPDRQDGLEGFPLDRSDAAFWVLSPDENRKLAQFTRQLDFFLGNSDEFLSALAWLLETAGHKNKSVMMMRKNSPIKTGVKLIMLRAGCNNVNIFVFN